MAEIVRDKFIKNYAMYVAQKDSKAMVSVFSRKVHISLFNKSFTPTNYFFRMLSMAQMTAQAKTLSLHQENLNWFILCH